MSAARTLSLHAAPKRASSSIQSRPFASMTSRLQAWHTPDTPLTGWGLPSRSGHAIHASEIDSEVSRIHALVKSLKAMGERIEKHAESGPIPADGTGQRVRVSVYGRPCTVGNANASGGDVGGSKAREFSTGSRVDATVLPYDSMLRNDEIPARLRVIREDAVEAFKRLTEVERKVGGGRGKM